MGNFHRFVDPSYHLFAGESFPGSPGGTGTVGAHTYDRINVISGGTGASGSANADAQKSAAGPNQYTYFVAFGEDATSSDANRGMRALAENCDVIDDILRGALPRLLQTPFEDTAVGTVSYADITDDVFVSDNGDTTRSPAELAVVTDGNDNQLEVGGTAVVVTGIQQTGGGASVIGTAADGFYTDPRITFSPGIPNGTTYRIYYGERSSLGRKVEADKLSFLDTQLSDIRNASLEEKVWAQGLNEKYRRSSKYPTTYNLDTAGDGAIIQRDGPAPEVVNNAVDYVTAPKQYQDPYLALWKASPQELDDAADNDYSGYIGYLAITPRHDYGESSSVEASSKGLPSAGFLAAVPRDIRADTLNAKTTLTRVDSTAYVTLNPESGSGDDARVVQLSGSDYFINTNDRTAVRRGVDLLELTWDSGDVEVYVIAEINVTATSAKRRAYLLTLGGEKPTFANNDGTAKARWIQPTFFAGGSLAAQGWASQEYFLNTFTSCPPPPLVESPTSVQARAGGSPFFAGWPLDAEEEPGVQVAAAFEVGGFVTSDSSGVADGRKLSMLRAYANGDLQHLQGGRHSGHLESPGRTSQVHANVSGTDGKEWDPESHYSTPSTALKGSVIGLNFTGAATYTLSLHANYTPRHGDRLVCYLYNEGGGAVSMTWPSSFRFSEGDDSIPSDAGYVAKLEAIYLNMASFGGTDQFYITKTAYDLSP